MKYVRIASYLTLALMSPASIASAAPKAQAPILTLAQAQSIAIAQHPTLRERCFDQFAAQEAIKIAKADYAPQAYGEAVQAFAASGTRLGAYSALSNPTIIQRSALGVGISQYITDFGRTKDLVQASKFELKAQAARTQATRDTVLLNVTQTYFEILRAQALLVVAKETRRERGTLLTQIGILQRAGLRSTLDVSIAARDVSEADQLLLEAQANLHKGFAALSEAMGSSDLHVYKLEDTRALPAFPGSLDALSEVALTKNPVLLSSQASAEATRKRAQALGRERAPTVTGYGFFGVTPLHANQAISSSYSAAGVTLQIPLYNGGALAAQQRQADDLTQAAEQNVASQRDALLRDLRMAYDEVKEARGTITVSEQLLKTARQALDFTQARYRIGLSSIADLSEAQLRETQAAISRTNATYDYIVREAGLEFAAGIAHPA